MKGKIELPILALLAVTSASLMFMPVDPSDSLRDINGVSHGSLTNAETDLTALFFLGVSCPISAEYAPEIIRICDEYQSKGTACFLVYPESGLSLAGVKENLNAYGYGSPAILDRSHSLVSSAGATITPEAA